MNKKEIRLLEKELKRQGLSAEKVVFTTYQLETFFETGELNVGLKKEENQLVNQTYVDFLTQDGTSDMKPVD